MEVCDCVLDSTEPEASGIVVKCVVESNCLVEYGCRRVVAAGEESTVDCEESKEVLATDATL